MFVAGASGRTGIRCVKDLLESGYRVRAGVRNQDKFQQYIETSLQYEMLTKEELQRLEIVQFDVTDPETIRPALGNAAKVVCALGAPENFSFTDPAKIDGKGTTALVEEAAAAGVEHFVLITSLGTGKIGWPAGALNLFGGILFFKKQSEDALRRSGMAYTIIRPGGMEKPTDAYKKTHNVRLAAKDTLFGGQVSRLQVAELVTEALRFPDASYNKIVEVVAETTAPATSGYDLLAAVPADGVTREQQLQYLQQRQELAAQLDELSSRVNGAQAEVESLEARREELASRIKELAEQERSIRSENAEVLSAASSGSARIAALTQELEDKRKQEAVYRAVLEAAKAAAREPRLLSSQEKNAIVQSVMTPPKAAPEPKAKPSRPEPKARAAPALAPAAKTQSNARGRVIQQEEEEQPKRQGTIFGFFGKKPEPVVEEEEEPEVEEEQPKRQGNLFGGLFGKRQEEPEPEPEPEVIRTQPF